MECCLNKFLWSIPRPWPLSSVVDYDVRPPAPLGYWQDDSCQLLPDNCQTPPSASRHLTNDRALSSGANASEMINMSLGIINEWVHVVLLCCVNRQSWFLTDGMYHVSFFKGIVQCCVLQAKSGHVVCSKIHFAPGLPCVPTPNLPPRNYLCQ